MKRGKLSIALVSAVILFWLGYRIYLAKADLVSLNVRDMDVRQVMKKIEWQTWETVMLHTNVSGNVTLNVRRVPLSEVLNIVALQTSSRWTAIYPLFLARPSLPKLEKVVRGEIPAAASGWENFEKVGNWQQGAGTAFGNTARAANNLVSAQIDNKDLQFAALALSRFSQARVVAEDNANATVNLKLDQVPFTKAVKQLANQTRRKWNLFYTLQPRSNTMIVRKPETVGDTNTVAVATNPPQQVNTAVPPRPKDPAEQARMMEALFATMTPEERQRTEEQFATMQQIQALPQADRQARLQDMAAQARQSSQADLEQRVRKRLRDGTTDQRVNHDREVLKKKQQPTPKQ